MQPTNWSEKDKKPKTDKCGKHLDRQCPENTYEIANKHEIMLNESSGQGNTN